MTSPTSAFNLSAGLERKNDPALIAADEVHFVAIAESLNLSIDEMSHRLDRERLAPVSAGQSALERDLEIHRLTARLRALKRYGIDLCLGRMVFAGEVEPVYVGRVGLKNADGRQLLLDWRSPAAEPFFGATHANPMGLVSRRRYRWARHRVTDYWDEAFTDDGLESTAALDDQSSFIASLGSERSERMRDVLATIQADQDTIIRKESRGALVVDGGPGTGKTVVALHRTAYLIYSDPRIVRGGGVLFVGPTSDYLSYVEDVLPSLGEESVQICTLRDLVAQGEDAIVEVDPIVAQLKSSANWAKAIETAVSRFEQPPSTSVTVETPWTDVRISRAQWREAFDAAEPGTPHNDARDQVWDALLEILLDDLVGERDEEPDEFDAYGLGRESETHNVRRVLSMDRELTRAFDRIWPPLRATDLVARMWSDPGFLLECAPWLNAEDAAKLERNQGRAWTTADLPLLDLAQQRVGDPETSRRRRRRDAAAAAERERMSEVVDQLIADDDSELGIMKMLRGQDLRSTLVDEAALPSEGADALAGPFAHIVVDEAQELTDAEWQMLLARCPSRSFTIVGDRAQARRGFTETWQARLERVGFREIGVASLSINYRTPREIMVEAEPVIRAALPDANVPTSVRTSGIPVRRGGASELGSVLSTWLSDHDDGIACVIGDDTFDGMPRVRSLAPELSKGLEFDLVVLIDPADFGDGTAGAVDRYVAMTRATQELVILVSDSPVSGP